MMDKRRYTFMLHFHNPTTRILELTQTSITKPMTEADFLKLIKREMENPANATAVLEFRRSVSPDTVKKVIKVLT